MNRCVSLCVHTLCSLHLDSQNLWRFSQTSHRMVLIVKLVRQNTLKRSGRKTCFSLVCMHVLHHVDKKSIRSMTFLKFERTSISHNLSVFTAVIKLSAFAMPSPSKLPHNSELECEQDHEILPEQASFRNIEIMWMVSFYSRK